MLPLLKNVVVYCHMKGYVKADCWKLKKQNGEKCNEDQSANIGDDVFADGVALQGYVI